MSDTVPFSDIDFVPHSDGVNTWVNFNLGDK